MKLWRIDTEIQTEEWTKVCAWERLEVQTERTGMCALLAEKMSTMTERRTEMCTWMMTVMEGQTEGRMVYACKRGEMGRP